MLAARGGKIVEAAPIQDETARTAERPVEEAPENDQQVGIGMPPAHPAPKTVTSLDACEVLCERDARCEERLAGKSGIDDWLLCYASRIEPDVRTPLPEECKPAFSRLGELREATCVELPVVSLRACGSSSTRTGDLRHRIAFGSRSDTRASRTSPSS